ncbi:MAG: agarase [Planctomycetes bacterium]|nr:agarase [Planctomycetota bacterium]
MPKPVQTTQLSPEGYFTLGKRGNRWILLTPDRKPFFSVGLNHIDSSPLRYPENLSRWEQKYENDTIKWIRESVAPNLKSWGFNSVGWVQEVSIRYHAQTPGFTLEEYRALDLPYCHLLPFIETHQWNKWHRNPDIFSKDFEDWCDYVARSQCARLKNESNLIGYFYSDCPTWVHIKQNTEWRGPMFDPERVKSEAGRAELTKLAQRYYKVTHDAIRRYDRHHLILGDRYEANAPLPLEIVKAAAPYVDVFSFQDFRKPVEHMIKWHETTGKPILWADGARRRETIKDDAGNYLDGEYYMVDGKWYADVVAGLLKNPGAIGAHLCGAYMRNRFRRKGLIDEMEKPDEEAIIEIKKCNQAVARWLSKFGS